MHRVSCRMQVEPVASSDAACCTLLWSNLTSGCEDKRGRGDVCSSRGGARQRRSKEKAGGQRWVRRPQATRARLQMFRSVSAKGTGAACCGALRAGVHPRRRLWMDACPSGRRVGLGSPWGLGQVKERVSARCRAPVGRRGHGSMTARLTGMVEWSSPGIQCWPEGRVAIDALRCGRRAVR